MTLRRRLSLWYGAVLLLCVMLAVLPSYDELVLDAAQYSQHEAAIGLMRFREVLHDMVLVSIPPLLIGLIGGWLILRRALRPLDRVAELAEKLDEHNLGERLPPEKRDAEIERLAQVFNAMAKRLDGSFQRVRDFTLNASHELKTPLAVLRGGMETHLRTWPNLTEDQAGQMAAQIEEIDRLAKIVDELSFLVKADAGQLQLSRDTLLLHELVREVMEDAEILAQPCQVSTHLEKCSEAILHGDRQRLRQVLLNLTDNAIKYNVPDGFVKVSLQCGRGEARIVFSNSGPGLSEEEQKLVFERFYRGPDQRGKVDGSGLGLSIARWITQQHGGRLDFKSGQGLTTVTLILPATCCQACALPAVHP